MNINTASLTSFLTQILAISIAAVDRMVEILKGWAPNAWLFKTNPDPTKEAQRCAWIHCLSGVFGGIAAAIAHIDLFNTLGGWRDPGQGPWQSVYWPASYAAAGVLASGGSAFWNHALDLIKASKITQEQTAITKVAANQDNNLLVPSHPTSFALAMRPTALGALATAGPCRISLDPHGDFVAKAGALNFLLVPTSGQVEFDPSQTLLQDASGANVSITCTANTVSFTAKSGQTYSFKPLYFFPPPGNGSAMLVEDCSPNTPLRHVNAATPTPTYTIKVA